MMYLNERSNSNQPKNSQSAGDTPVTGKGPLTYQFRGSHAQSVRSQGDSVSLDDADGLGARDVLNTANNRLQELLQLLYLLSRDPAVPSDARYHVTVAQSEIALLVRIMRNAEEAALHGAADHPDAGSLATPPTL